MYMVILYQQRADRSRHNAWLFSSSVHICFISTRMTFISKPNQTSLTYFTVVANLLYNGQLSVSRLSDLDPDDVVHDNAKLYLVPCANMNTWGNKHLEKNLDIKLKNHILLEEWIARIKVPFLTGVIRHVLLCCIQGLAVRTLKSSRF